MGKFLGMVAAATTMLLALACGGSSSGSNSSAATVSGTVDGTVISKADAVNYKVGLFSNGGITENLSLQGEAASLSIASVEGEDHSFTISNVSDGDYQVLLYKVSGATRVDVLKSFVSVSGDSVQLNKTRGKSANSSTPQMNALTTLIMAKAGNSVTALAFAETVTSILGAKKLSEVVLDGGKLKDSSGTVIELSDAQVLTSLQYVSMIVIAKALTPISDSASLSAADSLLSKITSASNLGNLLTEVNLELTSAFAGVSDTAAFTGQIQQTAGDFLANLGVDLTTGAFSTSSFAAAVAGTPGSVGTFLTSAYQAIKDTLVTLSGNTNIVVTGVDVVLPAVSSDAAAVASGTGTLSSFEMADSAFGSRSGTAFSVTTLAPVFKVSFSGNVDTSKISTGLSVTLTNQTSNAFVVLGPDSTSVTQTWANGSTLYLAVAKSASSTISSGELKPGVTYSYVISLPSNVTAGSVSTSGTVAVSSVTMTAKSVPVKLAGTTYTGVSSTDAVYYMNSASAIAITSATPGYGIIGTSSALNMSVTGSKTGGDSNVATGDLTISGIASGATSTTSATFTISSSLLSSGDSYTIALSDDQGLKTSAGAAVTDYPATLKLNVK